MLPLILGLVGGGLLVSAFSEDKKYAKGGSIPNNYKGKTPEEVWNEWSVEQRLHFCEDHNLMDNVTQRTLNKNANELKNDNWGDTFSNRTSWDWIKGILTEHITAGQYAKGGGISGTLHSEHKSPLEYLKSMGAKTSSDLNYSTKKSGIDYYVGRKGNKAIVVAFIEDESKYMIDKEDAREMAETANTKGIESVELYTNYGIELHSKNESPKTVGFDKIYKVTSSFAKGGEVAKIKSALAKNNNSLVVVCKSEGNPDYGQYAPISDTEYFPVNTLQEAAQKCKEYIDENDLGGGNWSGGDVYDINGKVIAHVTYNGRVWNTSSYDDKNKKEFTGAELTKSYYEKGGTMSKGGKTKKETMIKKETMTKKATGAKKPNAQTNKMKEVIAHAKSTRKDGEAWKTAVARAWKEMK